MQAHPEARLVALPPIALSKANKKAPTPKRVSTKGNMEKHKAPAKTQAMPASSAAHAGQKTPQQHTAPSSGARYTNAFKSHWVQRHLASGQSLQAISKEARIAHTTLSQWVKAHLKVHPSETHGTASAFQPAIETGVKAKPSKKAAQKERKPAKHPMDAAETIAQLRKESAAAVHDREALKHSLRILCQQ